jgi:hypothetical protein
VKKIRRWIQREESEMEISVKASKTARDLLLSLSSLFSYQNRHLAQGARCWSAMSLAHELNGSRRTKENNTPLRSIYTTPTRSLNQILLNSERRAVNLTSDSPNARIDGAEVSADSVYRQGAVRGWRNRRARAVLRSDQSRSPGG